MSPSPCKHHPQQLSAFLATEQPWLKYCKDCALNVALCGRTIEQKLTESQFQRKMSLLAVAAELKRTASLMSQTSNNCRQFNQSLEAIGQPISAVLTDLNRQIAEFVAVRDDLSAYYER